MTFEELKAFAGPALADARLDFLRWALPQCTTDAQSKQAASIAAAIGEVTFLEAQMAFLRNVVLQTVDTNERQA